MTELTKTREQLVTRAAQKLGIIASGETLEAEDAELIDGVVDSTIADLSGRDVITINDDGAIDTAVFEWLADCLADMVAVDFGKDRNPQKTMFAEARMRTIVSVRATYEPLKVDYF